LTNHDREHSAILNCDWSIRLLFTSYGQDATKRRPITVLLFNDSVTDYEIISVKKIAL